MQRLIKQGTAADVRAWLLSLPLTLTVKDYLAMVQHQTRPA